MQNSMIRRLKDADAVRAPRLLKAVVPGLTFYARESNEAGIRHYSPKRIRWGT
jgi:hypothetical protein